MGVVKNLMVRIGADVRGVVGGMKTAYQSTRQATNQIKNATADMKRSVKDSFSGSRVSIREYKETMASLRASQNSAVQNLERLQEKLSNLQDTYDSLKFATEGLDLTKPLSKQINEAYEKYIKAGDALSNLRAQLKKFRASDYSKSDRVDRILEMEKKIRALKEDSIFAKEELAELLRVAKVIGMENIDFASKSGMNKLLSDIQRVQQEMEVSELKAGELGQKLRSMSIPSLIKNELKSIGAAAGSAARAGVKQLATNLKNLGTSAIRGIASLPAKLLGIGRSAASSNNSLERMVRSIRNVGIVALGLRVFRGIFGELRGIISNYISQNEQLSSTISALKDQLGQALAPAINIVIAALQKLMPVVQTIASAVNAIFTRLFGNIKTTTSGIQSSAAAAAAATEKLDIYGFDQITKASDDSDSSDSGLSSDLESAFDFGELPSWMDKVLDWIDKMKEAFKAGEWEELGKIIGDGINAAVDAINAVEIGTKVGTFVNNLFTTLNSALATINFFNIGKKVGEFVTSGFQAVNWNTVGETIGRVITALPSVVVGFIQNTNWALIAQSISEALSKAMDTVSEWLRTVEWRDIGEAIGSFISNIKWSELFSSLGTLLWEGFKAGLDTLGGFIKGLGPETIIAAISAMIAVVAATIGVKALLGPIVTALGQSFATCIAGVISAITGWPALLIAAIAAVVAVVALWLKDGGWEMVQGFLAGISEGWESLKVSLDIKIEELKTKFSQGWDKIKSDASGKWNEIKDSVADKVESIKSSASQKLDTMRESLAVTWSNIKEDGQTHLSELVEKAKTGFQTMQTESTNIFNELRNELRQIWSNISSQLKSTWNGMISALKQAFDNMKSNAASTWEDIRSTISSKCDSVREAIETFRGKVSECWSNMLNDLSEGVSWLVKVISEGFSNMLMNIQSILQAIISGVTEMINSIISAVTSAMNALSRLGSRSSSSSSSSYSSSSVVSGYGGSVSYATGGDYTGGAGGTSMHLATGGVTTGPTYALIGEAGKEAVMPLERNTSWMDTLAQRITAFSGSSQETPMVFKFYLGGKKISQHVINDINSITQTTGVCPINV